MYDLAIMHGRCYIDGAFTTRNIYCQGESIALISQEELEAKKIIDASGLKVLPGFIDPHVHLHLHLGSTYSVDDFVSGSQLAAMGGVTTLLDFLDPIYDNEAFDQAFRRRLREAQDSMVDYSFHATLGNYHDDVSELVKSIKASGLTSIKVFTTYSDSNRRCDSEVIEKILQEDILMMAHSEKDQMIKACHDMKDYEESRSEEAELLAVKELMDLAKGPGRLYVVHVSSGHTLDQVVANDHVFFESCPQYFYLSKDRFLDDDGKKYLLAPPLRGKSSMELLKRHFNKLSTIGTDHCTFMLKDKMMNLPVDQILKGIGSLGFAFQLMHGLLGDEVIDKFTVNPAKLFQLDKKGRIALGCDADFAFLDETKTTLCQVGPSKSDFSVYEGLVLPSSIVMTILRGNVIMEKGDLKPSKGRFIRR